MSNAYEPMDVKFLRQTIRRHAPVFEPGKSSGFHVENVDGEHATVVWKNNGTDETIHRDQTERLSGVLSKSGYEVRLTRPANTTLIVRKVEPVVIHGSALEGNTMGPFETLVEKRLADEPIGESMTRMPASIRNRANRKISEIASGAPRRDIPLSDIDAVLRDLGYLLVQEDGTPWSGFLTGREGRANIDIGILGTQDEDQIHETVSNAMLVITWHKFPTGRYEVIAYVS